MKNKKGLLGITGTLIIAILVLGIGSFISPAMAADESATQLEIYPIEAESVLTCTPDTAGMVAYWPFEDGSGQLDDVIANPVLNNGSCTDPGCPTSNLSGKVGSAVDFETVQLPSPGGDEIRVAITEGLDFTLGGEMTIEAWVKTTQDCTENKVFVGRYEGAKAAAWWLGCFGDNKAAFHMRDSADNTFEVKSNTVINDGQWHHIVGTRDGTINTNKIYVDGVLENSITPAFIGELNFGVKDVTIGFFAPDPYYWFDGTLDEVALYKKALSAEDVARHYLDGQGQSYCAKNNAYLPLLLKNNTP